MTVKVMGLACPRGVLALLCRMTAVGTKVQARFRRPSRGSFAPCARSSNPRGRARFDVMGLMRLCVPLAAFAHMRPSFLASAM
jgi:hypothetical protein